MKSDYRHAIAVVSDSRTMQTLLRAHTHGCRQSFVFVCFYGESFAKFVTLFNCYNLWCSYLDSSVEMHQNECQASHIWSTGSWNRTWCFNTPVSFCDARLVWKKIIGLGNRTGSPIRKILWGKKSQCCSKIMIVMFLPLFHIIFYGSVFNS